MKGSSDSNDSVNNESGAAENQPRFLVKESSNFKLPPEYDWQLLETHRWHKCKLCEGTGSDGWDECENCNGLGVIYVRDVLLH